MADLEPRNGESAVLWPSHENALDVKRMLREIGLQLDSDQYPRIYNSGVIKPGNASVVFSLPGKVSNYVDERSRTSSASQQEPQSSQGSSSGSWASCGSSSLLKSGFLRKKYEAELDVVREAYPGALAWQQEDGMWLLTESSVLRGLGKKAAFVTAIPYRANALPRSWGFWTTPISWE